MTIPTAERRALHAPCPVTHARVIVADLGVAAALELYGSLSGECDNDYQRRLREAVLRECEAQR